MLCMADTDFGTKFLAADSVCMNAETRAKKPKPGKKPGKPSKPSKPSKPGKGKGKGKPNKPSKCGTVEEVLEMLQEKFAGEMFSLEY